MIGSHIGCGSCASRTDAATVSSASIGFPTWAASLPLLFPPVLALADSPTPADLIFSTTALLFSFNYALSTSVPPLAGLSLCSEGLEVQPRVYILGKFSVIEPWIFVSWVWTNVPGGWRVAKCLAWPNFYHPGLFEPVPCSSVLEVALFQASSWL